MVPGLFDEDLHGRNQADVWLASAALGGGALEDSGADDAAATGGRTVGGTAGSAADFDPLGLGVSDFFFNLVRQSALGSWIDHALHHLVFGDFLVGISLVFASAPGDFAILGAAAEAAA